MDLAVNLLVLRCKDVEITRRFYERLGFNFTKEKHGAGPDHYGSEGAGFVLELYPTSKNQSPDGVRIGFSTTSLVSIAGNIQHCSDVTVLKPPYATSDRLILLLKDPDGRKVEIIQMLHR